MGRTEQTPFEFPCGFPLKVVGRNTGEFEPAVREVLARHLGGAVVLYDSRASSGGKYLSITASFTAESREQLDAIYRELNALELVVMTL